MLLRAGADSGCCRFELMLLGLTLLQAGAARDDFVET